MMERCEGKNRWMDNIKKDERNEGWRENREVEGEDGGMKGRRKMERKCCLERHMVTHAFLPHLTLFALSWRRRTVPPNASVSMSSEATASTTPLLTN